MASGPITSWQIERETMRDFIFLGSKITEDGDCSHEIKRHLLLGRKAMSNLDSVLKSRDITLPTKVCLVKASGISSSHVWMWELDHKAECQRNDVFELWCWRRLLRVTWTARRSNPSIPQEISPEYWKDWCWSWSSNPLAIWYEELTHWKTLWERLKAKGEAGGRGWYS